MYFEICRELIIMDFLVIAAAQSGLNTGDLIFQLMMFLILLSLPLAIIIFYFVFRKRTSRLKRVEEKVDKILSEKDNKHS